MTQPEDYAHPLLVHIAARRLDLRHQWEEGVLTTDETFAVFEALNREERSVYRQLDFARFSAEHKPQERRRLFGVLVAAFVVGFFVSPYVYSKLFGYRSAEECALANSTRIGHAMCFDLYESKHASQVRTLDASDFTPLDPADEEKYIPVQQVPSSPEAGKKND